MANFNAKLLSHKGLGHFLFARDVVSLNRDMTLPQNKENTALHDHHNPASGPEDAVFRATRRKARRFVYTPYRHWLRRLAYALFAVLLLIGLANLLAYALDYIRAQQASDALREAYYADVVTDTPTPTQPPQETPVPTATPAPTAVPEVTATPPTRLREIRYPGNYYANISSRFEKIRRQNRDIIGWLTIDDLIDEAVVQRDNEYYLDRDYRGYHNVNGAIFLDENCDLSTRPYTLMLYGHNMKTGAMFGGLRNYENLTYYRNNPFITFDTAYEDGRYVIFAVATVSTTPGHWRYVDFTGLCSPVISLREDALTALMRRSIYTSSIDVNADDQLLLLITCVDDDDERRVIAARRIREGETEEALLKIVKKIRKR